MIGQGEVGGFTQRVKTGNVSLPVESHQLSLGLPFVLFGLRN